MPEGQDKLASEQRETKRLLTQAVKAGKISPDEIKEMEPLLKDAGVEPPSTTSVVTFDEPIEIRPGGSDKPVPEARLERQLTEEVAPEPPGLRPMFGGEAEAAPPTFYPEDSTGDVLGMPYMRHEAHFHVDPPPNQVAGMLEERAEYVQDPEELGKLQEQIRSIRDEGEDSAAYQNYSDQIWNEVRQTFQAHGRPVVRTGEAGWTEGRNLAESAETWFAKAAGEYAAPFLLGQDQARTFGAGRHAAAAASEAAGDPETGASLRYLEEQGVLPSGDERLQGVMEASPAMSLFGGITSMIGPAGAYGAARQLAKPMTKMAGRLAGGGGLARQVGAGAAAGAAEAGVGRAAERGIDVALDAAEGEEAPDPAGIAADVGASALIGAGFGAVPPLLGGIGRKWAQSVRRDKEVGGPITKLEGQGGDVRLGRGPVARQETQDVVERGTKKQPIFSRETGEKVGEDTFTPQTIQSEETAEKVVGSLAKKEARYMREMKEANEKLYIQHKDPAPVPQEVVNKVVDLALDAKNRFGGTSRKFAEAIPHAASLGLVREGDRVALGGRILDYEDYAGTALEKLARRKHARKGTSVPLEKYQLQVTSDYKNAKSFEEDFLIPVGKTLNANKKLAAQGGTVDDKELKAFDAAAREARREMFSPRYAETKAKHDRMFRQLDDSKRVLGLDEDSSPSKLMEGQLRAKMDEVGRKLTQLGDPTFETRKRILTEVLGEDPRFMKAVRDLEHLQIYRSLKERAKLRGGAATSGTESLHGYATTSGGFMQLRAGYPMAKKLEALQRLPPALAGYVGNEFLDGAPVIADLGEKLSEDIGPLGYEAAIALWEQYQSLRQAQKESR